MKKALWVIITLSLILAAFPLTSQAAPLKNLSWRAEYYSNISLSGHPRLTRYEDTLDHDWGNGSPGDDLPSNGFSARWTLTRNFDQGTYLFLLSADDGARVWLDGQLIFDVWDIGDHNNLKAEVYIEQTGNHELQVAYFENTGRARIKFDWLLAASGENNVGAWQGEYFINRDLEGQPTVVRQDGKIDFDWNSGSPSNKLPRDNFSVRWTRTVYLETGSYELRIQHDDGMRVYVDDDLVYNSWCDQGVSYHTRIVHLRRGSHFFKVEYYEHTGNAIAKMVFDERPGNYRDDHRDEDNDQTSNGVVIDNRSADFEWDGPGGNRYVSGGGYGSDFFWTYNTASTPTNSGRWTPSLNAGRYEVYAFIPGANATTRSARYRIHHSGTISNRVVNQSIHYGEWVSLGTYDFTDDNDEYVLLYDSTSEAAGSTQIAFDAIKFVPR